MSEDEIIAMHRRQMDKLRAIGEIEPERCAGNGDARRTNGNPEWRDGRPANRHERRTA